MAVILDLATQGAQMLLVLLLAPLLTGLIRKLKARLLRSRGRLSCSPIATYCG
jgi:formate hydrogenlyase subunit 4